MKTDFNQMNDNLNETSIQNTLDITSYENASSQKAFSETISVHCAFVPLTKWSQKCKHG